MRTFGMEPHQPELV